MSGERLCGTEPQSHTEDRLCETRCEHSWQYMDNEVASGSFAERLLRPKERWLRGLRPHDRSPSGRHEWDPGKRVCIHDRRKILVGCDFGDRGLALSPKDFSPDKNIWLGGKAAFQSTRVKRNLRALFGWPEWVPMGRFRIGEPQMETDPWGQPTVWQRPNLSPTTSWPRDANVHHGAGFVSCFPSGSWEGLRFFVSCANLWGDGRKFSAEKVWKATRRFLWLVPREQPSAIHQAAEPGDNQVDANHGVSQWRLVKRFNNYLPFEVHCGLLPGARAWSSRKIASPLLPRCSWDGQLFFEALQGRSLDPFFQSTGNLCSWVQISEAQWAHSLQGFSNGKTAFPIHAKSSSSSWDFFPYVWPGEVGWLLHITSCLDVPNGGRLHRQTIKD